MIRFRPTPPACAHGWDAIVTHAMTPCRNEGWVESYATNIVSLISCLLQGIWPDLRLAEWPVEPARGAAAVSTIAGKWKTETVVEKHLADIKDHALPAGEAENQDAILKKVFGIHISTAHAQCTERNHALRSHPQKPANVNVHYGVVFTGQTCLVSQLVTGPTPAGYPPFPGMAVSSICIAPSPREQTQSFIALMLGIIWACRRVGVAVQAQACLFPSAARGRATGPTEQWSWVQIEQEYTRRVPFHWWHWKLLWNGAHISPPTSQYSSRGYSLQQMRQMLVHSGLPTEPGRSLPVIRTPRTDGVDLTATTFTKSFSIVYLDAIALAWSNSAAARLSHTGSTASVYWENVQ
ncbi:hypothetical protein B0H13DRAFT_2501944 [Mycena leptocephala]|nr:hypothetical protein B0H13DRAFT_2501944 [Mycena leptocephala]